MAELKNIRIAISGIYDYAKEELPTLRLPGPGQGAPDWVEDKRIYKVYRPASVLAAACKKFSMQPLVHHHPQVPIDGQNFRDYAVGFTGDNPWVDYLDDKNEVGIRSTLKMMDDEALKAYENGEIQLSPGYIANFEWSKGTAPDGQEYDIIMKEITDVNHVALLPAGRGGEDAVVLDNAPKANRITVFDLCKGSVFDRIRKNAELTKDVTYEDGHVSHRKDGDYVKQGGEWHIIKQEKKTDTRNMGTKEKIEKFLNKNIQKDAESMLFDLGELNSLTIKGYGPKGEITNQIYELKNKFIPKLAEVLQNKGYKITIGDDYVNSNNQKKNVIYFEKDGVQVSFHGNFSKLDYSEAKTDEWNGLYNSWKYRTKEQQEEAKKIQDGIKKENDAYLEQVNKLAKDFILKQFKKYGIEPRNDGKFIEISLATNEYNPVEIGKKLLSESPEWFISLGQGVGFDLEKKIKDATIRYIQKKSPLITYNSTQRANIYKSRN